MKLRVKDVISTMGQDFVVEAVLTYKLAGKSHPLARAVDGAQVVWVEPALDDGDDRILILRQVDDLQIGTPPPQSISYKGHTYLPRLSGQAAVEIAGKAPDRTAGTCRLWRYRAAGDAFLQIEDWNGTAVVLAGESVHKGMVEILPGK